MEEVHNFFSSTVVVAWLIVVIIILGVFWRMIPKWPATFYIAAILWGLGVLYGMWQAVTFYPDMLHQILDGPLIYPLIGVFLVVTGAAGCHQFLVYHSIHELDMGKGSTTTSQFPGWLGTGCETVLRLVIIIFLLGAGGEITHRWKDLIAMLAAPIYLHSQEQSKHFAIWSLGLFSFLLLWDVGACFGANQGQLRTGLLQDLKTVALWWMPGKNPMPWDARHQYLITDLYGFVFWLTVSLAILKGTANEWLVTFALATAVPYVFMVIGRLRDVNP